MELKSFLTGIANAIRIRKGTSAEIYPIDFENEIKSIESSSIDSFQKIINDKQTCHKLFQNCIYDVSKYVSFLDTTNIGDMSYMFYGCIENTGIPAMNTLSLTNMNSMFQNNSKLSRISGLNTSLVNNIEYAFCGCESLISMQELDVQNADSLMSTFARCRSLSNIILKNHNNINNLHYAFYECESLTSLPEIETSIVTDMQYMCYGCKSLSTVHTIKMDALCDSSSNSASYIFADCTSLTSIRIENITNRDSYIKNGFSNCTSLVEAIFVNCNPLYMTNLFNGCTSLTTVETINLENSSRTSSGRSNMFVGCVNLTNLKLINIRSTIQIASGTDYGHLLTVDSLVGLCQECINTGSSNKLTVGSANLEKLASVYVKLTGEAEADETLPKMPMVVCESTDEGAMLIEDYMLQKNWALA